MRSRTTLLVQAGIRDRFELLLGGDSLAEKKPSPLPLEDRGATRSASRRAPRRSSAIRTRILRAARSAGFGFVLASYGYGKIDETELGSSPRIRSFAELPGAARH